MSSIQMEEMIVKLRKENKKLREENEELDEDKLDLSWFSRSCFSPNCIKWDSPETRQSFALWFPQTSCSTLAGLLLLVACWGKSS